MVDMRARFVAVSIFTVAPQNLSALEASARSTIEQDVPGLHGFCEGIVMTNEEQTQVLIVTQWDSKSSWINAEWEPRIQNAVAAFVTNATGYDVHTFVPVTVVHSP
jgi:heme-degrading monooxygenase HmoA